jgi:hypothetical protein
VVTRGIPLVEDVIRITRRCRRLELLIQQLVGFFTRGGQALQGLIAAHGVAQHHAHMFEAQTFSHQPMMGGHHVDVVVARKLGPQTV